MKPQILEFLIEIIIRMTIYALIGTILFRLVAKWILKQKIPFQYAFITMFQAALINGFVSASVGIAVVTAAYADREAHPVALSNKDLYLSAILWLYPIAFLIQSGIIKTRHDCSFGKACLTTLTMLVIALAIAFSYLGIMFYLHK